MGTFVGSGVGRPEGCGVVGAAVGTGDGIGVGTEVGMLDG
jgi:hypothetical protein